jgi:hypothetical protein
VPHAAVVELPEEVGEGGDVTDYFVRLAHTRDDFFELLRGAKPIPMTDESAIKEARSPTSSNGDVARLKSQVTIGEVIGRYLTLRQSGENWNGICPFHEDRTPSFVVYPQTQTFHCFGCQAHGDVITFIMRKEALSFSEALSLLKTLISYEQ